MYEKPTLQFKVPTWDVHKALRVTLEHLYRYFENAISDEKLCWRSWLLNKLHLLPLKFKKKQTMFIKVYNENNESYYGSVSYKLRILSVPNIQIREYGQQCHLYWRISSHMSVKSTEIINHGIPNVTYMGHNWACQSTETVVTADESCTLLTVGLFEEGAAVAVKAWVWSALPPVCTIICCPELSCACIACSWLGFNWIYIKQLRNNQLKWRKICSTDNPIICHKEDCYWDSRVTNIWSCKVKWD